MEGPQLDLESEIQRIWNSYALVSSVEPVKKGMNLYNCFSKFNLIIYMRLQNKFGKFAFFSKTFLSAI